jgi:hypothetical protein
VDHAPSGHPARVGAADGSNRIRCHLGVNSIPRPDLTVLGFVDVREAEDRRQNQRVTVAIACYDAFVPSELPRTPRVGGGIQRERAFRVGAGQLAEELTFLAPVRRVALDGSEYEAAPLVQRMAGVAWMTYYFGYRMGLVAGRSDFDPAQRGRFPSAWADASFPHPLYDFELVQLPPPFVEGEVVEYVNTTLGPEASGGHYFYAASASDRALLDQTPGWERTGRDFKSGGYLPVCRFFYRPPSGGATTHFFTARADECEGFKTTPGFTYEGTPFRASLPRPQQPGQRADDPARCPEKTVPLYRAFNDAHLRVPAAAPNHRYARNRAALGAFAAAYAWTFEGIALCVPE